MLGLHRSTAKHRGKYVPSPHWTHARCDPSGYCVYSIKEIMIRPYVTEGTDVEKLWADFKLQFAESEEWAELR